MRHIRCSVKESMNAMTTIATNHTVTMRLNMFLDDIANLSKTFARLDNFNCLTQCFVRYFDQFLMFFGHISNEKCFVQITMKISMVNRNVNVAQITILTRAITKTLYSIPPSTKIRCLPQAAACPECRDKWLRSQTYNMKPENYNNLTDLDNNHVLCTPHEQLDRFRRWSHRLQLLWPLHRALHVPIYTKLASIRSLRRSIVSPSFFRGNFLRTMNVPRDDQHNRDAE